MQMYNIVHMNRRMRLQENSSERPWLYKNMFEQNGFMGFICLRIRDINTSSDCMEAIYTVYVCLFSSKQMGFSHVIPIKTPIHLDWWSSITCHGISLRYFSRPPRLFLIRRVSVIIGFSYLTFWSFQSYLLCILLSPTSTMTIIVT